MPEPDFHPHVLLLDAMGTLVRLEPPAPALCTELRRRFRVVLSLPEAERAMAAEIAYYRAHMHAAGDESGVRALHEAAAEALRAALPAGRRLPAVASAELAEALVASLRFAVYDDVEAALVTARQRGMRVVVVSNWDCTLPHVLERVGLGRWLDGVLTSAQVGAAKPEPGIFAAALALVGADPAHALHVGDSLEEDVAGACAAGIRAVWLNRLRAPVPEGIRAVGSLSELMASGAAG